MNTFFVTIKNTNMSIIYFVVFLILIFLFILQLKEFLERLWTDSHRHHPQLRYSVCVCVFEGGCVCVCVCVCVCAGV